MGNEQQAIFCAMLEHDGDRVAAARSLGIGIRTLYRRFDDLGMHSIIDRCGWTKHAGPPRGPRTANTVLQDMTMNLVSKGLGEVGTLAAGVYGEDTVDSRDRVMKVLATLKNAGKVVLEVSSGRWVTA